MSDDFELWGIAGMPGGNEGRVSAFRPVVVRSDMLAAPSVDEWTSDNLIWFPLDEAPPSFFRLDLDTSIEVPAGSLVFLAGRRWSDDVSVVRQSFLKLADNDVADKLGFLDHWHPAHAVGEDWLIGLGAQIRLDAVLRGLADIAPRALNRELCENRTESAVGQAAYRLTQANHMISRAERLIAAGIWHTRRSDLSRLQRAVREAELIDLDLLKQIDERNSLLATLSMGSASEEWFGRGSDTDNRLDRLELLTDRHGRGLRDVNVALAEIDDRFILLDTRLYSDGVREQVHALRKKHDHA